MATNDNWPPLTHFNSTSGVLAPQGWQCPSCQRCYSPSIALCTYCPPGPVTSTSADAVDFIATGHLGTPCPKPRDGGMCGCDDADFEDAPRDCYRGRCDC